MQMYLFIATLAMLLSICPKSNAINENELFCTWQKKIELQGCDADTLDYLQSEFEYVKQTTSPETFKKLINSNNISHLVFEYKKTLLYRAIESTKLKTAKLLIEYGADVNKANYESKETPLHEAVRLVVRHGPQAFRPIRLLLEHGANPNAPDKLNTTPFIMALASFSNIFAKDENNSFKVVELLLKKGANATIKSCAPHMPDCAFSDFFNHMKDMSEYLEVSVETCQKLFELLKKYPTSLEPIDQQINQQNDERC